MRAIPFVCLAFVVACQGPVAAALPASGLQADVAYLASPALSGRQAGTHMDYHKASDIAARVNFPGLGKVVDVAEGIARAEADR